MTKIHGVNASLRSIELCPEDAYRKKIIIYNDSQANLYISLDDEATRQNFSVRVSPHSLWEVPAEHFGAVYGVWGANINDGKALITVIK